MKTLIQTNILALFLFCSIMSLGQWTSIAEFPTSTDGSFSFVIDGKAYLNGGLANNDFYSYNESTNQWVKLADVPSNGSQLAWAFAFSINGKGYVGGGAYETANDLSQEFWEYDPQLDSWSRKADIPTGPRDGGYSFSIGNKGYIGAGFDGQFLHSDLYEYNPDDNTWTQLTSYPGGAVIFPASFVINGKAYVGTGDKGSQGGNETNQFWEFNPISNSWTRKAEFPGEKRQTAIGYSIDGKGYIGGGMFAYSINRTDFWEYNPANNNWHKVYNADIPEQHTAWSSGFVIGNNVYFGLGVEFPAFTFSNTFYKRVFSPLTSFKTPENIVGIIIYPNPSSGNINIRSDSKSINSILLTDMKGSEIMYWNHYTDELDVSSIPSGMYILTLYTSEGIVKEKVTIKN